MTTAETPATGRPSSRQRLPVPEGTIPVGIALLIAGVATYAFFIIGNNAVGGDEAFAPITALWFATFALAPGFFLPLEQELGRALAHRRANGEGTGPVVKKVVQLGVGLTIAVVLVIAIASPIIAREYFGGDWTMVIALALAFAAYGPAHLARGICSGSGRFESYAIIMGSDGVIRILLCIVLAAFGVVAVGAYGLAVAVAPLFAVGYVFWRGNLATDDGPAATWGEVTPNLGWLLLGSVCAASLLNAGPIAANLLAEEGQEDLVTWFSQGVLLARIPLFLFQAVQAALLPRLSRLAAEGAFDEFRSGLKRLMAAVLLVGVVGTVGAFVLGPWALDLVFGADLSGRTMAVLAFSSACYMMALATAQAVIALKGHALVAVGWGVGAITFVVAILLGGDDVFRRVEIGLLASSIAAMLSFAVALRFKLQSGATPDQDSIMDAITDMPLEM
jgi:O-antigen/teichoic acid export membrane protein